MNSLIDMFIDYYILGQLLSNEKQKDVIFTDYGHTWEALRRVSHSAVRYL